MANTPFELYEEAYRLHYREKNIPEAVKIYEAIVRDFPDANECGYAFIQLQKIKAAATTARLSAEKGGRMSVLVIPALAVSCIALLVALGGLIMTLQRLRFEHDRSTLAIAALARIADGKNREAGLLVNKIKAMNPSDELVRELTAAGPARASVSEPVTAAVKPAADSAAEAGTGAASVEMKKSAGHQRTGRIRAISPDQRTQGGQSGAVANPEPSKF